MNEIGLNLARKWRSKNFDLIIGQDLAIRMLKNSLYLDHFFPVYLFSGQRGCGKTTTARVFSAAVNCENSALFQKDPKNQQIPCGSCSSCKAFAENKHPDFIEIDAASHTGVDNVRQIIDSSTLLPLLGRKKIYLIDEAHMLSKAAFNALLKILEEPPATVLFILATTDLHKIIETVRSRCFQLFFKPVEQIFLLDHLKTICAAESVAFDDDGLNLIIRETEGSVRDALNVLEQVRFSHTMVSKEAVLRVLGHLDDARLIEICRLIVENDPQKLLLFLRDIKFEHYSAPFIWNRFVELLRALLWFKYGVKPQFFHEYHVELSAMNKRCSLTQITDMLSVLYASEAVFARVTGQHTYLEIVFLQMCQRFSNNKTGNLSSISHQASADTEMGHEHINDNEIDDQENTEWDQFLKEVEMLKDPLIISIFKQGKISYFNADKGELAVEFSQDFLFFKDWLDQTATAWVSLLQNIYGKNISFKPLFTGQKNVKTRMQATPKMSDPNKSISMTTKEIYKKKNNSIQQKIEKENKFTITTLDATIWPKSALVLNYFPGQATELIEGL